MKQPYQKSKHLEFTVAGVCLLSMTGLLLFTIFSWLLQPKPHPVNHRQLKQEIRQLRQDNATETIERIRPIIREELQKYFNEQQSARQLRLRLAVMPSRGGSMIDRINRRLDGTRMAGRGREWYIAAIENSHDPRLLVAVAYHESWGFRATPPGSHNYGGVKFGNEQLKRYGFAWGKGPDGRFKYQRFESDGHFIQEYARFVARVWGPVDSPYDMRGYAQSPTWAARVSEQIRRI